MTTALIVPFGADDTKLGRARKAIWHRCKRLWRESMMDTNDHRHLIVASDPLFGTPRPDALEPPPRAGDPLRTHPFSVARAINRAVRLAPPDVDRFVCIGADALPDWRVVDWATAELNTRPWTLLFGKGASFGPDDTQSFADGRSMDELREVLDLCYHVEHHPTPTVGPIAFTREAFLAVRGYDERFEGWGYEDVDLWSRLRATVGQNVYHPDYGPGGFNRVSPYPLIQFSHPVTHHDLTDANPNVRLWKAKCGYPGKPGWLHDHPAEQLFGGDEHGPIEGVRP